MIDKRHFADHRAGRDALKRGVTFADTKLALQHHIAVFRNIAFLEKLLAALERDHVTLA